MVTETKLRSKSETGPGVGVQPQPRLFTIDDYFAMAEAGILGPEERVELIDGVVITMPPIGNPHNASVDKSNRNLVISVGTRGIVRTQGSIALNDRSMPQPDLVLLRERDDFYSSQRAGPQDILLLIEVSDSSADYDRNVKLPRYAEAGIPEVWIAVIPEGVVEAHTEPAGGRYTQMRTFRPGDTISPGCFPDIALSVDEILPG